MPLYEYKCVSCGNVDEFLLPVVSEMTKECLKCGEVSKRIVSNCGFSIPGFKNGQNIKLEDC